MAKAKMGRKSKLNDEVMRKRLCDAIKLGAHVADACAYAGLGESTFYRWMAEGESASQGAARDFWEAVTRARAEGRAGLLAIIEKAARDGDWKAAAWKLERTAREHYGKARMDEPQPEARAGDEAPTLPPLPDGFTVDDLEAHVSRLARAK